MQRSSSDIRNELLVFEAQDGDEHAMDSLAKSWTERLYRFAYQRTGNPEGAWDVVQEAWVAIVKGIRKLDDPAFFGAWSRCIVANKSADWIKNQQVDRRTSSIDGDTLAPTHIKNENVELIQQALRGMSHDRRAIIKMYYSDSLKIDTIAQVLGIAPGTVKSRLFHARKELKELLERNQP